MRYTTHINLPIVEDNDLYSKEINNLAFERIDEEIKGLTEIVETLKTPENSLFNVRNLPNNMMLAENVNSNVKILKNNIRKKDNMVSFDIILKINTVITSDGIILFTVPSNFRPNKTINTIVGGGSDEYSIDTLAYTNLLSSGSFRIKRIGGQNNIESGKIFNINFTYDIPCIFN